MNYRTREHSSRFDGGERKKKKKRVFSNSYREAWILMKPAYGSHPGSFSKFLDNPARGREKK